MSRAPGGSAHAPVAPLAAKAVPLAPAPPLAYIAVYGALMGWASVFNRYADRPQAKGSKR